MPRRRRSTIVVTGKRTVTCHHPAPPTAYMLLERPHKIEVNLTHCTPGTLGISLILSSLPFVAFLFWSTVRWQRFA